LSPATKNIAAKMKDKSEVSFKIRLVAFFTIKLWCFAAASLISGIKRVDTELSIADGKKRIGNAIPFIIPNCDSAEFPVRAYLARFLGTNMFSTVLSAVLRYLPDVIGIAIEVIFLIIGYGGRFLPHSLFSFFFEFK